MISRRVLLSWLGVSAGACAVTAGSPLSAATGARAAQGTRVINLESFCIAHGNHESRLDAYLADTLLPRMQELHEGPRLCLHAIVAPHIPQATVLAAFSSFDEMLEVRSSLASSPDVRQARAELESARILEDVRSQVLVVREESLHFPTDLNSFQTGIFEMRSYDAPAWHDGVPTRLLAVLHRARIHPIVNAATAAGEHMPRFTYVVPFASLAAREQAWSTLEADAEWIDMQRESTATVTGKSIYKLAPYSRLG
ncbi:MAG TPA: NIPSNAP family protein [Candidatus Angelobacter sp.]